MLGAALGLAEVQVWKDVDGEWRDGRVHVWRKPELGAHTHTHACTYHFTPHPPHAPPLIFDNAGVLTSDPRICQATVPVKQLTFEEATELAYFGAQVRGGGLKRGEGGGVHAQNGCEK